MSSRSLERTIRDGDRLLVDSTALIAYVDQREAVSHLSATIMDEFVLTGRNAAVISMVSIMEALIRPLRQGVREPYRHLLDFINRFPNLRALPVDLHVAQEAATLRATYGLSPPDALIVGTAIVSQVGHIVTNDERWVRKLQPLARRVSVVYLNRYV